MHDLKVQIHDLKVQVHDLKFQMRDLKVHIHDLKFQMHDLKVQIHDLKVQMQCFLLKSNAQDVALARYDDPVNQMIALIPMLKCFGFSAHSYCT